MYTKYSIYCEDKMKINDECRNHCPRGDRSDSLLLAMSCRGVRVSLEKSFTDVDAQGNKLSTILIMLCGSTTGPDVGKPSISVADIIETPLSVAQLKQLHDAGLLPDQAL